MKCQKCEKPANFHITELTGGKPQEVHLCEDHAREYLTQAGEAGEPPAGTNMAAAMAQQMAQQIAAQMAIGQTADELEKLDQQACPVCGITFYEFRSQGRLGCPNDYVCFKKQLEPLILNIHGESQHVGKSPKGASVASRERTQLIRRGGDEEPRSPRKPTSGRRIATRFGRRGREWAATNDVSPGNGYDEGMESDRSSPPPR